VALIRQTVLGRDIKAEQVYSYLTSAPFRLRVCGILEGCAALQADLEAEKRFLSRHWAKRQGSVDLIVSGTASIYGDLQGVIGSLPEVQGLNIPMLEDRSDSVGSE
jgi:hypothetical protein